MDYKLFIGIDISKLTIDVASLVQGLKEDVRHCKFDNNQAGFKKMLQWLSNQYSFKANEAIFLMEHTGVYALPLCTFFSEIKMNYCLESPLHISRSMGIKRGKNDKADAVTLVKFAYLHREDLKIYKIPAPVLIKLKALLAFRDRLVKSRKILHASAKELKDYTSKSIHDYVVKNNTKMVEAFNKQLKQVEAEIQQLIKSDDTINKTYKLVTSVPGIGPVTGAYLIVYTKCFTAFENHRKFACYAGLAPFEHQSGISIKGRNKVSPIANRHIKTLLTNGAVAASQHDKELSNYFQRRIEEGKSKLSTINVIRNKMVSRVFAAVKRGTPYVDMYDRRLELIG